MVFFFLNLQQLCSADKFPAKPQSYVTDQANVLDSGTRQQLESLLGRFESASSVQVAVVTLTSLGDDDINAVAADLFKTWGIGQKGKDNGVLFLIAPNERRMRIEVGYGLEGIIPDSLAGRILDEVVVPRFKTGDINGGVLAGTAILCRTIAAKSNIDISQFSELKESNEPSNVSGTGSSLFTIILLLIFIIVFARNPWLLLFLLSNRNRDGGWGGGGGFGGGGFGGFGGGMSGGGGASRGW